MEKSKATKSQVFFQTPKKSYENFKIELIKNGDSREEVLIKLMDLYSRNGKACWEFLLKTK